MSAWQRERKERERASKSVYLFIGPTMLEDSYIVDMSGFDEFDTLRNALIKFSNCPLIHEVVVLVGQVQQPRAHSPRSAQ